MEPLDEGDLGPPVLTADEMEPLDEGDMGPPVLTADDGLTSSVPHPSRVLFMVPLGPGW